MSRKIKLKKAIAEYINKTYDNPEEEHEFSPEFKTRMNQLLSSPINKTDRKGKTNMKLGKSKKMSTLRILTIAVTAVVLSSAVVYASSPALREFLNMRFLKVDSVQRITKVPEGYIGIYTAEDLNNVRNDLYGNYILMNNIFLTEEDYDEGGIFEGGFVPIGNSTNPFYGIFNGNGYVISGLVINGNYNYAGLFGKVIRSYNTEIAEINQERSISGGIIKNLGVTDSVINVIREPFYITDYKTTNIGAIAGYCDYIIGCYTENIEITVDVMQLSNENINEIAVGGVAGHVYFSDSCHSNADIKFTHENKNYENVYIAGIAGYSFSCVTSYFNGMINSSDYPDYGVTYHQEYAVPIILTEKIINEIVDRLDKAEDFIPSEADAKNAENHCLNAQKFLAFYCPEKYIAFDMQTQDFYTNEVSDEIFYLLDPTIKKREYEVLSSLIAIAFPNNDFSKYCQENNVKSGYYYCYDLRDELDCTFDGFDFNTIWDFTETTPQLKLFTGGNYLKTNQEKYSDNNKFPLEWQKRVLKNITK